MLSLARAWLWTIPFFVVGFAWNGKFVSVSYLGALLFALAAVAARPNLPRTMVAGPQKPLIFLLLAFILAALLGLLDSPFEAGLIAGRAGAQILGIAVVSFAALVLSSIVGTAPYEEQVEGLLRSYFRLITLVSIAALVQFAANNLAREELVQFAFLNLFGAEVWHPPGWLGPLYRASSIAAEPAHLARFLAPAIPFAFLRLGIFGAPQGAAVSRILSGWAAAAIILAACATLSLVAFAMAGLAMLALVVGRGTRMRSVVYVIAAVTALSVAALMLGTGSFEEFLPKVESLNLLLVPADDLVNVEADYLSAVAVMSNRVVAFASFSHSPVFGGGLGSHALSYGLLLPSHLAALMDDIGLYGLNAEDAAGLFLRLVSETGIAGLTLFSAIFVLPSLRAIRLVRRQIDTDVAGEQGRAVVLVLGSASGLIALFGIAMARYGAYFDPVLWAQLGLTVGLASRLRTYLGVRA